MQERQKFCITLAHDQIIVKAFQKMILNTNQAGPRSRCIEIDAKTLSWWR